MLQDPDFGSDYAPVVPLPPDLDHDRLIEDFICAEGSLFELADAHGLTIDQLLCWYHSPKTQARLSALEDMADTRTRLLAKFHAPASLSLLAEVTATDADPREQRRAAAAILRYLTKISLQQSRDESQAEPSLGEATSLTTRAGPGIPRRRPSRTNCAEPRPHPPSDRVLRVNLAAPLDPPPPPSHPS